jgi:hypothetical protein
MVWIMAAQTAQGKPQKLTDVTDNQQGLPGRF